MEGAETEEDGNGDGDGDRDQAANQETHLDPEQMHFSGSSSLDEQIAFRHQRIWIIGLKIEETKKCRRCRRDRKPTLTHIINKYTPNYPLMTKRHNRLANSVRKAVIKFIGKDPRSSRSDITDNSQMEKEGLSAELQRLRPDMVFERRERNASGNRNRHRHGNGNGNGNGNRNGSETQTRAGTGAEEEAETDAPNIDEGGRPEVKMMEIVEFSCPYGHISHRRNTLERVFKEKKRKYAELARELKRLRRDAVRVTAMIVSSMGAVYEKSLKKVQ
jgi:hypothetical protein